MPMLRIPFLLGERLSDLFLGEAAQQKHGELAPRISSNLRGEQRCFLEVSYYALL